MTGFFAWKLHTSLDVLRSSTSRIKADIGRPAEKQSGRLA
jgi:hypothetical protein